MIRLLTVGDQHFDSVTPSSRKDDYFEALKAKVTEIREIAIERQCNGVLWTGDLINKQDGARVPYFVVNWLIDYFRSYPDHIKNYVAMGNHDIKSVAAKWERQPIGAIVKANVISPLWTNPTEENPLGSLSYDLGSGVCVSGKLFDYDADSVERRQQHYRVRDRDDGRFHIMVCHTALLPEGATFFGHYSTVTQVAACVPQDQSAQLYVCGHIHDYLGKYTAYHITAVNFGALARGSIDEFNLKRTVMVGYVEVSQTADGFDVKMDEIHLKSAVASDLVFRVQELEKERKSQHDLDRLAESLRAGTISEEFRLVNSDDALEVVIRSRDVRPAVGKLVREYVDSAKRDLT